MKAEKERIFMRQQTAEKNDTKRKAALRKVELDNKEINQKSY